MGKSLYHTMLVPVDGSASAESALRLALTLVARDGRIILVHVIDRTSVVAECVTPYGGDATPALEALEADEREIFARTTAIARAAGVACSTVALDGHAARSIVSAAQAHRAGAIAMGTHGRTGIARLALGNTAADVIGKATVPVFVVHEQDAQLPARPFGAILVAYDASPAAQAAAREAVEVAQIASGRVVFAHVTDAGAGPDEGFFDSAAAVARAAGVASDTVTLHGSPVDALVDAAVTAHAGLIAIGAQGVHARLFGFGSVAHGVVRTSPVPVLVLPAPAAVPAAPFVPAATLS